MNNYEIEQMSDQSKAVVEVPGVKVEITQDDTWETVGMIVAVVLAIYLGIKLINKYIK